MGKKFQNIGGTNDETHERARARPSHMKTALIMIFSKFEVYKTHDFPQARKNEHEFVFLINMRISRNSGVWGVTLTSFNSFPGSLYS